jgi:hypothetical protein
MFRVVFNDQSGRYRVERKGWFGWNFVQDESGQYVGFDTLEQARAWVREHQNCRGTGGPRRWRIVDCCGG